MRGPCLKVFCYLRVFFKFYPVEIFMPLCLALHVAIETTHTGISRDFICLGSVSINVSEFTCSVSYSIVKLLILYKNNSMSHTWGNKNAI